MNSPRLLAACATLLALATAPSLCAAHDDHDHAATPAAAAEVAKTGPMTFGAPVTVKKATPIAKVEKKPARFTGKTLKLEGVVREVCQGRGCWIEIESADGSSFLAKSLDESVLVPKDCKGWQVAVEGVVTKLDPKGHEGHAHAAGEMEEGHACPSPSYVLATKGVILKPASATPKP